MKRAIEEYFPIVEINRLAVPERNSFKPIYQMHKWFARRASCVFRAILLGCLKPAGTDIMAEFYEDHTDDPDTNGKVILDPFMGGGTTVVEALRLGCKVIGIDLNPVAWFIVKTEVEPVDIDALKDAFDRLAERQVEWTGKSVRETLLDQYKTECPCCGAGKEEADIIYTFWVKSAVCTNPLCKKEVPLFSDYIIAQKKPSIRYHREMRCPREECGKTFDWEIEPATLIADSSLMLNDGRTSAGELRGNVRWAYGTGDTVRCPWCQERVNPLDTAAGVEKKSLRTERKKVLLAVLMCPHCEAAWQWRGALPDEVTCPVCRTAYDPNSANIPDKGKFVCSACGTKDAIIASIRKLPEDQLLPMKPYAIEGYCARCGGDGDEEEANGNLFAQGAPRRKTKRASGPDHQCHLTKNNGKFFKRIGPADLARYQKACQVWELEKERLPHPKQEIPDGQETHRLLQHHYRYWHQMFNARQSLCLATLLKGIDEEPDRTLEEMLLSALFGTLEANNMFARYRTDSGGRSPFGGVFARHDFQPKLTPCEINVWGPYPYYGAFSACFGKVLEAKQFCQHPSDTRASDGKRVSVVSTESIRGLPATTTLRAASSAILSPYECAATDFVITDPPYAGNVNYSELADFFYVWLRLLLARNYQEFSPDLTPKADEVIENPTRRKTARDFELGLTQVFREGGRVLDEGGLLVFTFHHADGSAWEALLRAVCNAGFEIDSVYPIHGESESSMHLLDKEAAISYDLIHVCKKRDPNASVESRSWAGIRQEIRRRARAEIRAIESGRYGNEPLSSADVNIVLIGKCLELYSRHYGVVIDHEGRVVELHEALKEIRSMVDDLVAKEHPLPSELEDIDAESRLYLLALCDHKEVKSDDVSKVTRGVLEPDDLLKAGLIIKGRAKRGRTYEVKQPIERYRDLLEKFQGYSSAQQPNLYGEAARPLSNGKLTFIDHVHFLMGLAEAEEDLRPWMERFRGLAPQIRAACEYMRQRNAAFASPAAKILGWLDPGSLFQTQE